VVVAIGGDSEEEDGIRAVGAVQYHWLRFKAFSKLDLKQDY
jgi:hypothetical protein